MILIPHQPYSDLRFMGVLLKTIVTKASALRSQELGIERQLPS